MKANRVVAFIFAGNLLLLAVAASVVFAAANTPREVLAHARYKPTLVKWMQTPAESNVSDFELGRLSPLKRPPAVVDKVDIKEPPPKIWSDVELAQELQAQLQADMTVLRIMFAPNSPDQCFATIRVKSARGSEIMVRASRNFLDELRDVKAREFSGWLENVRVCGIDKNCVVLNAPSQRNPEKRFDVTLTLSEGSAILVSSPRLNDGGAAPDAKSGDERPHKRLPR